MRRHETFVPAGCDNTSAGEQLDDQDTDPIAEALSSVAAQFAGETPPDQDAAQEADEGNTFAAAPSDEPEADDTDESTDALDAESDETPAPQAVPWEDPASPYHQHYLAAQQTQRERDELAAQRDRQQAFFAALRQAKETEDAKALHQQLTEVDPQLAQQWLGQRTGLVQQAAQAAQQTVGYQHGMAALHLAMTDVLGNEQVQQIVGRARELAAQPGLDAMQHHVATRRQAAQGNDARVAELEAAVRELTARLSAKGRPKAADVVDSAPSGTRRAARPEDAEDMDGFFAAWAPQLAAHFGG